MPTTQPSLITIPAWIVASSLVLFGSACADIDTPPSEGWVVADETPTMEAVASPVDQPPTIRPTTIERLDCELETSTFGETWWVEPHFNQFSANEGLYFAGSGYAGDGSTISVADGSTFSSNTANGLRSVDDAWKVGAFVDYQGGARIVDLASRATLVSTTSPHIAAVRVSPDGKQAAFITCGEDSSLITLVDLVTITSRELEVDLGSPCYSWAPTRTQAGFTSDGRFLVATTASGTLWSINTDTLAVQSVEPHGRLDDEALYGTIVSDMRVRPGTHEVATTGVDGTLRRWSLDDMSKIGDDIEVGYFRINEYTYAPQYDVSPVAFTPDGVTMAYVNRDGDVVVSNSAGSSVLPSPAAPPEYLEYGRTANIPVTLSFGPSGRRLGVSYYWGAGIWGCPGAAIARRGSVEIDVPAVVQLDERGYATVPISVSSGHPVVAIRAVTRDSEAPTFAIDNGQLMFWNATASEQVVTLEADDGSARSQVTVRLRLIQ